MGTYFINIRRVMAKIPDPQVYLSSTLKFLKNGGIKHIYVCIYRAHNKINVYLKDFVPCVLLKRL